MRPNDIKEIIKDSQETQKILRKVAKLLKCREYQIITSIEKLLADTKRSEKERDDVQRAIILYNKKGF
jgi:hypothetical protein